jgi:hypothetical protein
VPPWEDLHELSQSELRLTNLVTTDAIAEVFPRADRPATPVAALAAKQVQDRVVSDVAEVSTTPQVGKSTRTAEATAPTGGAGVPAPAK